MDFPQRLPGPEQLAKVVDYFYVKNMDAAVFDEETFLEVFWSFLIQPYFVPDQEIIRLSMDFHFQVLFQGIFKEKLPTVVNLVRSPYYTPDHHLDFIECEVVDRFFDLFGHTNKSVLYHTAHVDPDRTHCLNGMFLPALINEHPFPLVVTFEDGSVLETPEGKQVDSNTTHLARWEITNPVTSGKVVDVRSKDGDVNDRLRIGKTGTFWSYHGNLWTIHENGDSDTNNILWQVIANATDGILHSVELFELDHGLGL